MGVAENRGPAIVYAIALFVFPVMRTLVEQAYFFRVQKVNMSARPPGPRRSLPPARLFIVFCRVALPSVRGRSSYPDSASP